MGAAYRIMLPTLCLLLLLASACSPGTGQTQSDTDLYISVRYGDSGLYHVDPETCSAQKVNDYVEYYVVHEDGSLYIIENNALYHLTQSEKHYISQVPAPLVTSRHANNGKNGGRSLIHLANECLYYVAVQDNERCFCEIQLSSGALRTIPFPEHNRISSYWISGEYIYMVAGTMDVLSFSRMSLSTGETTLLYDIGWTGNEAHLPGSYHIADGMLSRLYTQNAPLSHELLFVQEHLEKAESATLTKLLCPRIIPGVYEVNRDKAMLGVRSDVKLIHDSGSYSLMRPAGLNSCPTTALLTYCNGIWTLHEGVLLEWNREYFCHEYWDSVLGEQYFVLATVDGSLYLGEYGEPLLKQIAICERSDETDGAVRKYR